ncbi:MAG: hypothetical protein GEU90_04090 [Gemmatimonas sp.]|nr:hypothetical protein [Gemmatimonas sp.]
MKVKVAFLSHKEGVGGLRFLRALRVRLLLDPRVHGNEGRGTSRICRQSSAIMDVSQWSRGNPNANLISLTTTSGGIADLACGEEEFDMATQPEEKRWTYSEFARLPDDGKRYEVIAGELYVSPSPRTLHQLISSRLSRALGGFVEKHGLGWVLAAPVDVLFAEGNYMVPDLVFVPRERVGIVSDRGIEAAPDLIVEIVSPSSARVDRGPKLQQYMRFGVPLYWVVDPDAGHVEVHQLLGSHAEPLIEAEILAWRPVPAGPTLTIEIPPLFRGFE